MSGDPSTSTDFAPSLTPAGSTQRRRSNVTGISTFRADLPGDSKSSSGPTLVEEFSLPAYPAPPVLSPITQTPDISQFNTPYSTRPPSPIGQRLPLVPPQSDEDGVVATTYPDIGSIKSWRGAIILLVTCGSQLLDNIFMTAVNISLPAIQREFGVKADSLQWLISAYTLTFGGFLLLSGVLSDRYGRKKIFCLGMGWISVWTLANGFGSSFIQLAVFRALQGIGAAMTVPSSVGIISSYFIAKDRTTALSFFAASGAVGFCSGLIFGGFLTSSLGWRYIFRIAVAITGTLAILGIVVLPKDRLEGHERPRLDFLGAALSSAGLILLSFVLSSGGLYGWNKAFIIVLLIASVALLFIFTWVEKKVRNPIMPLSLWKVQNFAGLWITGFVTYGSYQIVIYYIVLVAQEINGLSAGQTALRFLPMGATGFAFSLGMGKVVERFNTKTILLVGLLICMVAPIPTCIMKEGDINFWSHVLPTSILIVAGVTIVYCSCTIILLGSVPNNVKSLCGGMINTAFQIGSGVGLALTSAIVSAVDVEKGHGIMQQYRTGLWCCVGFAGIGFVASLLGVKSTSRFNGGAVPMH